MASINQVTLLGIITKDPELKYTKTASYPFCNVVLKSSSRIPNAKTGQQTTETIYIRCYAWGKLAEWLCNGNTKKGDTVIIRGRIQSKSYRAKTGAYINSYWIMIEKIDSLEYIKRMKTFGVEENDNEQTQEPEIDDSTVAEAGSGADTGIDDSIGADTGNDAGTGD